MKNVFSLLTKKDITSILEDSDFLKDITCTQFAKYTGFMSCNIFWTKNTSFGNILVLNPEYIKEGRKNIFLSVVPSTCDVGVLPVIKDKRIYENINEEFNDADEIEFGEYPITYADKETNNILAKLLESGDLPETRRRFNGYHEYWYKGNRYVAFTTMDIEEYHFFKVEKVKWINLRKQKMFICKNILIADKPFNNGLMYSGIFSNSDMYKTLDLMYRDMMLAHADIEELSLTENEKNNPLKFEFITKEERNNLSVWRYMDSKTSDFASFLGYYSSYIKGFYYPLGYDSLSVGYLPIIKYDLIKDRCKKIAEYPDYLLVSFGEYPIKRVEDYQKLNWFLNVHKSGFYETGKTYRINENFNKKDKPFKLQELKEYEIDGKKYVKIDDKTWFEVNELEWLVDVNKNKAVCTCTPFAGLNFDLWNDVENSDLNKFIMKYFAKEILPSKSRNVDKINEMISSDIALQMLMNKQNLTVEDLELDSESKLVLRR